jgi:hypothetical protein
VTPQDGAIRLDVNLGLPNGYKISPDAPLRYQVEATAAKGPVDRAALDQLRQVDKPESHFTIDLPVGEPKGSETLKISLAYFYCQEGPEGVCKTGSVVWTVPVKLSDSGGESSIALTHDAE